MPVFTFLSPLAKKVQGFLMKAVRVGAAIPKVYEKLREVVPGLKYKEVEEAAREIEREEARAEQMRRLELGQTILDQLYSPTERLPPGQYYTVLKYEYRDPESGERFEDYYAIRHSRPVTVDEILNKFLSEIELCPSPPCPRVQWIERVVLERGWKGVRR